MKEIRIWFSGLALLAASGLAQASFSYNLTGPSNIVEGQSALFNIHVSYTPYDLTALTAANPNFSLSNFSAYSAINFINLQQDGDPVKSLSFSTISSNGKTNLFGSSNPYTGVVSGLFDPSHTFEYDFGFSMSFANAGNYSIVASGYNEDVVYNQPSAACLSNPKCAFQITGAWYDVSKHISGFSSNSLGFTVSAVPEPETLGLMLLGLGVVGAVARRRKSIKHTTA